MHAAKATFFLQGNKIDINNSQIVEIVWRMATGGHRLGNHSFDHRIGNLDNMTNMCWEEVLGYLGGTENKIRSVLRRMKEDSPYRYYALAGDTRAYVDQVIAKGTGLFRAPGGDITAEQIELLSCWKTPDGQHICPTGLDNPYNVYKWDVDTRDWAISDAYEAGEMAYTDAVNMLIQRVQEGWYKNGVVGIIGREIRPSPVGSFGVRSNTDDILFHSTSFITAQALNRILDWLQLKGYTFDVLTPG